MHLLKRVDFYAIVDHLALTHITKSKAEMTTTRIKRLLEILNSYSFNFYNIKGKDMGLSDFLSRQKHNDSNPHETISILFSMQNILQSKYYNIGKEKNRNVFTSNKVQDKSSGIRLPEVQGIGKGLDPNVLPERQVIKPIVTSEAKGVSQIKPMLDQGRAVLRWKIKTPMPSHINKCIVKLTEKTIPYT